MAMNPPGISTLRGAKRRSVLLGAFAVCVWGSAAARQAPSEPTAQRVPTEPAAPTGAPRVTVWKSPTCGCCTGWVEHMRTNGFRVEVDDSGNAAARARLGIPQQLGSCHTALVAGYAIEGHVPASDIRRLLKERPAGVALAVPGMPIGAPGMDGPEYGGQSDAFDVLLVQADGSASVYRRYR